MAALTAGVIDGSADVVDTVPIFAPAARAKTGDIAQAPSPEARAILPPGDSLPKPVADLESRKVAVTEGAGSHDLLLAALAEGRATLVGGGVDACVA